MNKVYILSDTHFGHENIIKYCNRPFTSVQEMDEAMIKNWNSVVDREDTVLHLGDFGLGKREYIRDIIGKLNGKKILIKGNHDHWSDEFYRDAGFWYVSKFPIVYRNFYILSHAPIEMPHICCYGNLYGHVHDNPQFVDTENSKCYCVERINYTPQLLFDDNLNHENDE